MGFRDRRVLDDRALNDRYRSLADLDRLHVRAVHDTWGIAEGFAVTLVAGGTAVEVAPGVGYAADGTPVELTAPARVAPRRAGEHDVVVTADGISAVPAPRWGPCPGSLAVASATADTGPLRWTAVRPGTRWVRRRESAPVRAGSQVLTGPHGGKLVVTTADARFPRTPLYFCDVDTLAPQSTDRVGLMTDGALNRDSPRLPRHGPFSTICGATRDGFTILFTRPIGTSEAVRVRWIGVVPLHDVPDLGDPCLVYPYPPIIN